MTLRPCCDAYAVQPITMQQGGGASEKKWRIAEVFRLEWNMAASALRFAVNSRLCLFVHLVIFAWYVFTLNANNAIASSGRHPGARAYGGRWKYLTFINLVSKNTWVLNQIGISPESVINAVLHVGCEILVLFRHVHSDLSVKVCMTFSYFYYKLFITFYSKLGRSN